MRPTKRITQAVRRARAWNPAVARELVIEDRVPVSSSGGFSSAMSEMPQLASFMLVLVFAAVMLITGELYIQSMPAKTFILPMAQTSGVKQSGPSRFRSTTSTLSHETDQ
jgi:hypothetical protein